MSFGIIAVDHQERINFPRLRQYRLNRTREAMKKHKLGALLCYDKRNVRYITSTYTPTWMDSVKLSRYCVLPGDGEPVLFEMGARVAADKLSHGPSAWLGDRIVPAISWGRDAVPNFMERAREHVAGVKRILEQHGVAHEPVGIDMMDVPLLKALEDAEIEVADGMDCMLDATLLKSADEIELLRIAAMMVDATYDRLARAIRPGVTENQLVGLACNTLYSLGSDEVVNVNAISGPRTNPHHHDFSDRHLRPGDIVFFDIVHSYNGYHTCYYRTFCVGKPNQKQKETYQTCLDWLYNSIKVLRPGITTKDIAERWPGPEVLGAKTETEVFASQFGHGVGISHWERPIISRTFSLDYPVKIEKNMHFALETYAGKPGEKDGVRLEEQVLITDSGYEVITRYPVEELIACPIL
jgi:Xaa-Pro aminopeptidase